MKNTYSLLLLIALLFPSCQGGSQKAELVRMVNEWQGKEIVFPKDIVFTHLATDTVDYSILQSEYRDYLTRFPDYFIKKSGNLIIYI